MVAKISAGSSLFGALSYNGDKVKETEAKVLSTNKLFCNPNNEFDISACLRDFGNFIPTHYRTEKTVIHVSLNPHPDDKLTDEQFSSIATEYMDKLGYGNQPFIVFKHEDIERRHIHIVSLRIDENGAKINDSFEKRRSMDICRELEQKYNLHTAEKQKRQDAYQFKKVDAKAGDVKRQIGNTVKGLASTYRFASFNEYRTLLSLYNISVEQVKGEVRGKPYAGLIYSAINEKSEKISNPFKASLFGKNVGYDAIEQSGKTSTEPLKIIAIKTRLAIKNAQAHSHSRRSFEKELSKQGIDLVLRQNDTGRIYGVTFIDHNNHCVFNGSRLGKDLSANAIQEWFNNPQSLHSAPEKQEQQTQHSANDDAPLGGLFDLPIEQHGPDYEEEAFRRRMQRKKKKKQIKF